MPITTHLVEDLERQDSSNSSKSENGGGGEINEANVRPSTSENCIKPKEGTKQLKTKKALEAKRCSYKNMAVHVSEKLKSLGMLLKSNERSPPFAEGQPLGRQQQPSSASSSASQRLHNALIATNARSLENEKTKRERQSSRGLSVKGTNKFIPQESGGTRKPRHELEAEIRALHQLVDQLSLENPELRPRIVSLAKSMPALGQTGIAKLTTTSRLEAGQDNNAFNQGPSTSKGNSASDTCVRQTTQMKSTQKQYEENEKSESKPRNRGKRSDRNRKQKCHVSELRDLTKYINNIVEDHLTRNEASLGGDIRNKLKKFEGNFDELETYAAHLVELGLGRIVEDALRVNRKNNRQSFITMSADREALERDGMVMLPVARRYAFEGDIVRAFVLNAPPPSQESSNESFNETPKALSKDAEENCTDEDAVDDASESLDSDVDSNELDTTGPTMAVNCPKAFVIDIIKHTDNRKAVGSISFKKTTQLSNASGELYFKFVPLDTRLPVMYVPESIGITHAEDAKTRNEITDLLYLAQVCETDVNGHCIAELLEKVGKVGHLEHELKAILMHNNFKDIKPYEQRFEDLFAYEGLPPPAQEFERMDLRSKCIFTIDPPTARDLDDALSIDEIDEDEYEVGVHIADVAYFLAEGSELDDLVKSRATSIYLVNEVIHMLPVALCYKCSLIPGEDKLAFSVFWRMNRDGQVLRAPRFARSIVNSCTKFAYGHAQKFIEKPNAAAAQANDFPDIHNGFTLPMIAKRVQLLHTMAQKMRQRRYSNGALSINNPKLRFELDPVTGEPVSFDIDSQQESNNLIEEFMLLANMTVAQRIYEHFPDIALLRQHAPPLMTSMKNLHEKLSHFGINLDYSSSKAIYRSMQRICSEAEDTVAMNACLSTLLTKPMARAKYICSKDKSNADMWHYALSIPIYTHFTSPIRRYPDILVHRLLAATLDYCPPPKRTSDELTELAKLCNDQKLNAKNASDESSMLYFKRFVKARQGITLRAAVLEIHKHLVNVVTVVTGHVLPIIYKSQRVVLDTSDIPNSIKISEKGSRQPPMKLKLFSSVDIKLVVRDEKLVAFFVSPDWKQRQMNYIEKVKNNNGGKSGGGKSPRQDRRQNNAAKHQQQQKQEAHNIDRSANMPQTSDAAAANSRKREQEVIVSRVFQSIKKPHKEEHTRVEEQQKR